MAFDRLSEMKASGTPGGLRTRLGLRLHAFRRDEDGSMILFSLFILILMLMAGGVAIDAMRAEYTRVTIQNTLDRAVLAAADLDQSEDAKGVVIDYFDKANLSEYLDTESISVDSSTAAGQLSYRRVTASASTDVPALFLPMLGIETLAAAGVSSAEEGITDLEISLILDVSGSMGWASSTGNSKIYELRNAAKDFVHYMQCNPNTSRTSGQPCSVDFGKVSITMVPYSEQVVVGETLLSQFMVSDEHNYSHCVTFSADEFQDAGIPLDVELQRAGHFDPWSNGDYANDNSRPCRLNSWRQIRPYVANHNDLYSYIGSLSAGGNTSIDVAMKWGAALLDPDAQEVITALTASTDDEGNTITPVVDPAFDGRPYNYTDDYTMKVIVLMTDGVNTDQHYLKDGYREGLSEVYRNTYYSSRFSIYNANTGKYYYTHDGTWNDWPYGDADGETVTTTNTHCSYSWWYGYRCWTETTTQTIDQPGSAVQMTYPEVWDKFTTDWYDDWSWLETPESSWGNGTKNARLDTICDATKEEGVIVYTIGFEVTYDSSQVMTACASTPGHYFSANGANLSEIFGTIANSINQLRLTQ